MSTLARPSSSILSGISRLRRSLDARIIGQSQLKDALVLGLVSKEHVYVEGPPGAAKTLARRRGDHRKETVVPPCYLLHCCWSKSRSKKRRAVASGAVTMNDIYIYMIKMMI